MITSQLNIASNKRAGTMQRRLLLTVGFVPKGVCVCVCVCVRVCVSVCVCHSVFTIQGMHGRKHQSHQKSCSQQKVKYLHYSSRSLYLSLSLSLSPSLHLSLSLPLSLVLVLSP